MKKLLIIIGISVFFLMIAAGAAYNSQIIHVDQLYRNMPSSTCYQPTTDKPHEDAVWNLDECYWFVDDPNIPYELQQVLDICFKSWGMYHDSKSYQNGTHSIDTTNCVWETPPRGTIPVFEFETPLVEIILSDCFSWRDSTFDPVVDLRVYSNDTHSINNVDCEWELIEKDPNPTQLGGPIIVDPTPLPYEQLQKVLNYCEEKRQAEASNWIRPDGTDWAMITIPLEWHNSTHYIGNNGCMWENITTEISSTTATFGPKIYPLPEELPEVMAFYAQYPTTQASVREDHMSYFAGSSDAAFIRMNVFYDDDKTLDHIETKCYFQKVLQFEIAQEDIVNSLEKYDCKK